MKINNFDYIDLAQIEMQRLKNLHIISDQFEDRERNDKLAIVMDTFYDYTKACKENEEAYAEVVTGLSYDPVELHTRYCENAEVEYCVCGSYPLRKRIVRSIEPF